MAKGDTMSRLAMGIQPGLKTPAMFGQVPPGNEMNAPGAADPSQQFMANNGMSHDMRYRDPSEIAAGQAAWNAGKGASNAANGIPSYMPGQGADITKNNNPMFGNSVGNSLTAPRMAPMTSGHLQAQGKHPLGTNPQKMLKYGSGNY